MYQGSYETLPNNLSTEKFCGSFCIRHTNVTEVYTIAFSLKNDCSSGHDEIYGIKYSRMDQVKFFKGCLPQILFGPILNTLSHINPVVEFITFPLIPRVITSIDREVLSKQWKISRVFQIPKTE